jgi:hypothetical protein
MQEGGEPGIEIIFVLCGDQHAKSTTALLHPALLSIDQMKTAMTAMISFLVIQSF